MSVNTKAEIKEANAFKRIQKMLGSSATAFALPAGSATSFPDFGFRVKIGGKKVDIHFEYKADSKAQMGSMRDWRYNGTNFTTPNPSPEKDILIDIMNDNAECKRNGDRLLADFQKYFDPSISEISSGMLSIEKDKKVRKAKLQKFIKGTKNYQLANIDNAVLGGQIINHYKTKFNHEVRKDADYSILLMMIDNSVTLVSIKGRPTAAMLKSVYQLLGLKIAVPKLSGLTAKLEVRIQPRHLDKEDKPVSIDVMANFRLSGKPPGVII